MQSRAEVILTLAPFLAALLPETAAPRSARTHRAVALPRRRQLHPALVSVAGLTKRWPGWEGGGGRSGVQFLNLLRGWVQVECSRTLFHRGRTPDQGAVLNRTHFYDPECKSALRRSVPRVVTGSRWAECIALTADFHAIYAVRMGMDRATVG